MSDYDMLNLKNGGRWLFWLTNANAVNEYIRQLSLAPVQPDLLEPAFRPVTVAPPPGEAPVEAATSVPWERGGRYGGIRVPHFHSAGKVYLLNEQQWAIFSDKVMNCVREKLAATQRIGYDQLMSVADAVSQL